MEQCGTRNTETDLATIGLSASRVWYNLSEAELCEQAICRQEATLTASGALRAQTGQHTGRSPKDKFVVRDAATEGQVWWDNNRAMAPQHFETLLTDFQPPQRAWTCSYRTSMGGADGDNRLPVRVVTEYAWHSLFIRNLLIRPAMEELAAFVRADDHRPADLQGRPGAPRMPQRDGHRCRPFARHRPDRRHGLCRRDEEIGLHRPELPAAGQKRHADALLRQCRPGRRRRRSSSGFPAPARPRFRPTRAAR
jgi:hypothetical protein